MSSKITKIVIQTIMVSGKPIGKRRYLYKPKRFFAILKRFLDNHNGLAWVFLRTGNGETIEFLKKLDGTVAHESGYVRFLKKRDGALSFNVKKWK